PAARRRGRPRRGASPGTLPARHGAVARGRAGPGAIRRGVPRPRGPVAGRHGLAQGGLAACGREASVPALAGTRCVDARSALARGPGGRLHATALGPGMPLERVRLRLNESRARTIAIPLGGPAEEDLALSLAPGQGLLAAVRRDLVEVVAAFGAPRSVTREGVGPGDSLLRLERAY